ncbi:MAG: hypothetical protein N4A36_02905 [Candidatus Gracilibacteria bacterium]|jgi:hypothetical protein|nr:hypothetical protein [Candidatus Gracilibacteria bacterium]
MDKKAPNSAPELGSDNFPDILTAKYEQPSDQTRETIGEAIMGTIDRLRYKEPIDTFLAAGEEIGEILGCTKRAFIDIIFSLFESKN